VGQTRGIPCTRPPVPGHTSVDVLGCACRGGRARAGKPPRKRRPSRQTRRHARKRGTDGGKAQGRERRQDRCREVNAQWRGDSHDSGVHGHSARLQECCTGVRRLLCTWRHRRSQRRSYPWTGVRDLWHHCRVARPPRVGRPPPRWAAGRAEAGLRTRVCLQRPVREHRPPGSVRGRLGNWPSYRDGREGKYRL
jgi:hypothetical protein